jgi:hypothetical protein
MDDRSNPAEETAPPRAPLWVKVLAVMAGVLVLLVVGLHLTGHVPSHHFGATGHAMDPGAPTAGPR